MKKSFIIILVLFLQNSALLAERTITLATGEWEPFTSQNYENHGIANALVKEIFKIQNIDVIYKYYPWKRAMLYVKTGEHEGSTIWMKTKQRELDFLYSKEPILTNQTTFFYLKKTKFNWNGDITYLKNFKLGTSLGYFYSKKLNDAIKSNILTPDVGIDDYKNIKKLLLGRIEVFVCDKVVCLSIIKKNLTKEEQKQIIYSKIPLSTEAQFLILNKKQKELKKEFDIGFEKLKKTKKYKKIIMQIEK